MILRRLYDDTLAQASYLIGCAETGEALVVDPLRDVAMYLDAAAADGVRITDVTETHIHADFLSGSRELARAAGARLHLSAEGGADWQYGYAADEGARLLRDGDVVAVGNVRVEAWHTPGHTPEHLSFLVTDTAGADRPMGMCTGDFVFVGAVGRPDLLEKAAGIAGTMESAARELFRSLQRFRTLPDYVQLWPGHGAGSACGKSLGAVPQSTVGYEKLFNTALGFEDEDEFVAWVLADQPEAPRYFATMKRLNRDGPPLLGGLRRPPRLGLAELDRLLAAGAVVVDARPRADYAAGHLHGAIGIPLNRSFTTWAGALLPYDVDLYLVVGEGAVEQAVRDLALIGLDRVAGFVTPDVVSEWAAAGRPLERVRELDATQLASELDGPEAPLVVDVRGAAEYAAGHLPGVPNIPLAELGDRLGEIPRERPVVLQCQGGTRSTIAAGVLQARGFPDVRSLAGGYRAWAADGRPVETEGEPQPH